MIYTFLKSYMRNAEALLLMFWAIPFFSVAQDGFFITHGPYIQALDESSVSILWTTNKPGISWVELAPDDSTHFYREERRRFFAVSDGIKVIDTLHHVRLEGLQPGTGYRYRVYSHEVKSHRWGTIEYGRIAATQVYRAKPLFFKTSDPVAETVSFAVINDIHGNNELMERLLDQVDFAENDLIFFNGDMASFFLDETQLFADFMDTSVKRFAAEHPMYYVRGNHETRGPFAGKYASYFPTVSGKSYYLLRRGPVCFVVLDSGEDKPDSDIEYSNVAAFDDYRTVQAAWLKEIVQLAEYREAPYKVIICHMPPFGGWHGEQEVATKFVPVLNEANAQVMLSGHLHRHLKRLPGNEGHVFPVLVNSNQAIIRAKADSLRLQIEVCGPNGEHIDSMTIYPDGR